MSIKEMCCQTCADAGLPQRYSWSKTKQTGIAVCGICQHSTDFRIQHALKNGRNKWFHRVTIFGKAALRCNEDGKWVLPNWREAESRATFLGKFAYRSPKCGHIHLSSSPVRM